MYFKMQFFRRNVLSLRNDISNLLEIETAKMLKQLSASVSITS